MTSFGTFAGETHLLFYHLILYIVIICCWTLHQESGLLAVILLVLYCRLVGGPSQARGMGCELSKVEPLVCEKDIDLFLTRWQRVSGPTVDQSVNSHQSSSDYSILKIEEKSNSNLGSGGGGMTCPTNWVTEVPEMIGVALVALLAMVWLRRWNRCQYLKQYRRAMGLGIGLQTVSSTIPMQPGQGQLMQEGPFKSWVGRNLD